MDRDLEKNQLQKENWRNTNIETKNHATKKLDVNEDIQEEIKNKI